MKTVEWERKSIDVGNIKEEEFCIAVFRGREDTENKVEKANTSCGCMATPTIIRNDDMIQISVKLKVGSIPYHLKKNGFSEFKKNIFVTYKKKQVDKLEIKGLTIKK
jgi:hypothetical protein